MITTVLYDMNGIIVDDEHIHELAFYKVMQKYNVTMNHQHYMMLCAGRTDKEGFELILEHNNLEADLSELMKAKQLIYFDIFKDSKVAYPGIVNLIKNTAKEFEIALVTSSLRNEVEMITEEFGIRDDFKAIITADDITRGKPDPEPYLKGAAAIQSEPSECVVIEDSKSGVTAAVNAGMKCIGVTTTHQPTDLIGATIVVKNFKYLSPAFIKYLA